MRIAARDAWPEYEFGLDFIPKTGPRFQVIPGRVKIEPEQSSEGSLNGVLGEFTPGDVEIGFTPAKVRIYMERYASLNFRYEPEKINLRI